MTKIPAFRPAALLQLRGVSKRFGSVEAVREVHLEVIPGELLVIVGPSGCGKTTLLRLIAGLEEPDSGSIRLNGADCNRMPPSKRDIGMVFQNLALYPHFTVMSNLALPLKVQRIGREEIRRRVEEVAALLSISELLKRYPSELSGGQLQRVAIGRALIRHPQVLLLDEPLSNIDPKLKVELRRVIRDVQSYVQSTTVYITHDQDEAASIADRVGVMIDGQLCQVGKPATVYDYPVSRCVADFLTYPRLNVFAGTIISVDGSLKVATPLGCMVLPSNLSHLPTGTPLEVGVRPEDLEVASNGEMSGTIHVVHRHFAFDLVEVVSSSGKTWFARAAVGQATAGTMASLRLPAADRVLLFEEGNGQ